MAEELHRVRLRGHKKNDRAHARNQVRAEENRAKEHERIKKSSKLKPLSKEDQSFLSKYNLKVA